MAEVQVGHDVGLRHEIVGMQVAERLGLDGAAEEEGLLLEQFRHVRHQRFAHFRARVAVQHQAEGAFGVVLANEQDRPVEKRPAQLPVIEKQLAFQRLFVCAHRSN